MSGKQRGHGKMTQLADYLFANKKCSMGIALGLAGISYILALLFGEGNVLAVALDAPLMGGIAFVAMFLVMGLQLINPFCSPRAMDFGELFFGLFSGGFPIIWFVITGFWQLFGETAAESATTVFTVAGIWCALCIIHNMRK